MYLVYDEKNCIWKCKILTKWHNMINKCEVFYEHDFISYQIIYSFNIKPELEQSILGYLVVGHRLSEGINLL